MPKVTMDEQFTHLRALECELHEPKTRRDRQRLVELLHPDFFEFGRSGNTSTRVDALERLPAEENPANIHAQEFAARQLAVDVVLLNYKSADVTVDGLLERHALRTSIWRKEQTGWQMVFHQGTATSAFEKNAT